MSTLCEFWNLHAGRLVVAAGALVPRHLAADPLQFSFELAGLRVRQFV